MLMEHSAETTNGAENVEKSGLLDLQRRVYDSSVGKKEGVSRGGGGSSSGNGVKRKRGSGEDQNGDRKKSKKEVSLSSLSSSGKSKKRSGGGIHNRGQSSRAHDESGKSELVRAVDKKSNGGGGGFGGISLTLNGSVNIPKRPRDVVRRKKVEVDVGSKKKEEGPFSKANSAEGGGQLNGGDSNESLLQNGEISGKIAQNGDSQSAASDSVLAKFKRKKKSNAHKENRSAGSDLLQCVKREDSHRSEHNGNSSTKKARRNHKKVKKAGAANHAVTQETKKQVLNESSRICDDSQDDEENLEANAARMLSTRFETSCTGFSSDGKNSKVASTNGLSALISSSRDLPAAELNCGNETDGTSSDAEARNLRPRNWKKGKGPSRKRRHFYELLSRDLDSYWVLNQRIKVFWPLDQSWYYGHIAGYDPENKLHHIKYDDREEEWVNLQNERFKLLLLPNEVPGKVGRKRSRMQDNHARKGKHGETADLEGNSNSMESEPIISWLARSNRRKSQPFVRRKKQKTLNESAKSQSSSFCEVKIDPRGSSEVGPSGRNADDLVCSSAFPENSVDSTRDVKSLTENFSSLNNRPPIVYFRRRLHRREQLPGGARSEELCQLSGRFHVCGTVPELVNSTDVDADMLQSIEQCGHSTEKCSPDEFIWDTDESGCLELRVPVSSLKVFRCELTFPLPGLISKLLGGKSFMSVLQHGVLMSLWPMVHLEMLFVDNIVGLRFFLFEGCLKEAVFFVFLVMAAFHQSNQKINHFDQHLPVTSIRFRLTGLRGLQKQLVFTFYNFSEMSNSRWSYIDKKLKGHCLLTKQLPPAECTYDNIKALRSKHDQLPLTCVSRQPSSVKRLWKSRQHKMDISPRPSAFVKLRQSSWDSDKKQGKFPPFALSFTAAPTFFLSLHLKLLMERSIPSSSFGEQDPISLIDHSENQVGLVGVDRFVVEGNAVSSSLSLESDLGVLSRGQSELESCFNLGHETSALSPVVAHRLSIKAPQGSQNILENETEVFDQSEKERAPLAGSECCDVSAQPLDANDQFSPVQASGGCGLSNGITVEIPSCDSIAKDANGEMGDNHRPVVLALDISNGAVRSPISASPRNTSHRSRVGSSCTSPAANLSPAWSDGKQDPFRNGFGNGPKRPRTQVSYSLPLGGHDYNTKNKPHHAKGFSHKRIRRASEKKISEACGTSQRNMEMLSCEANVLITVGDRGWRECGARIVLELVDHSEWRLAVKLSGDTKYSYKAHQFLQPGTTNRYTHVMMWKGGKDWILEFPDRSQWTVFKEMHEECYNRNIRAASVKNIPIPGVRLVEESDDSVPEVPFVRPSPKYYRQMETDVDIAMDPSRVMYDMDSDDEHWIGEHKILDSSSSGCGDISEEMFEKTMDVFEKVAYAKQCDRFSSDELDEDMAELGPPETIKAIYEHWRKKRHKKGMPLIRHLQPPLWEKYQQQVKEWEQAITKCNASLPNGCQEKPTSTEKPPMFAFCMKPRGLEVPNRGSKQRSQKKLPIGALSNAISVDSDAFHCLGRRSNGYYALGDDRLVCSGYNQGTSDTSPVLQGSTRVFSPRDPGGAGYFSLSSDGSERNHYPKLYRNKSKKLCSIPPANDHQAFAPYSQRTMAKRNPVQGWQMSSSEWTSQMHYPPDGFRRHSFEQLDPSELDEFRLRDAASAARHAVSVAKMRRENAQRMLCRADLAMHKAVSAIMTAEAINASYKEPDSDS